MRTHYCRRYRPATRHAQPVETSTSHVGFRCIVRSGKELSVEGRDAISMIWMGSPTTRVRSEKANTRPPRESPMHAARPCFQRILKAIVLVASLGWLAGAHAQAPADPLPSWNDGAAKKSITDFVARVTTAGRRGFRAARPSASPPSTTTARCGPSSRSTSRSSSRIDRVKALAPQHPEWKTKQPFKAVLDDDTQGAGGAGRDRACCRSWRRPIPA